MKTNLYTHFLLTVIAALLAWNAFLKLPSSTVHAQSPGRYSVVGLTVGDGVRPSEMADQINKAAGNGELVQVMVIPRGPNNWVPYAIFRSR